MPQSTLMAELQLQEIMKSWLALLTWAVFSSFIGPKAALQNNCSPIRQTLAPVK
jgi:hypothetical protein